MRPHRPSAYEQAIREAILTVAANLDDPPDLARLAATAALSPLYFHRIFTGLVGETPLELHRRLRIERAATELTTTDTPITRMAFAAGYASHEAFTRAFRDQMGVSPRAWRQRGAGPANVPRVGQVFIGPDRVVHIPEQLLKQGAENMDVQITRTTPLRVAATTHVGPYDAIGDAFGRVGELAGRAGLFAHPEARMVAIYHDDPESTPAEQLRSAAAVIVPEGVAIPDGLHELVLPGGDYARTTHVGPYTGLGAAWAEFMGQWLPRSGRSVRDGDCYEMYLNSPMDTPADQLRTELFVALV